MQIKYRIPAAEIFKLSLSPYHDDIAVFHVRAVSELFILNCTHIIHMCFLEKLFSFSSISYTAVSFELSTYYTVLENEYGPLT